MTLRYLKYNIDAFLKLVFLAAIVITLSSCDKDSSSMGEADFEINQNDIVGNLQPWSLIDEPVYVSMNEARTISDIEMVFVYKGENQIYIYPSGEMTHVEIVNDRIDGIHIAITYCPLTKSGIAWRRDLKNEILRFTPSGMLYNSNLLAYDYETKSIWSQMRIEAIQGDRNKQALQILPLLEIPWGSIKDHFPDALVFTGENKSSANGRLNAGDQKIKNEINSISGERVFGIIKGNQIDIFQIELFKEDISILEYNSNSKNVLVGSSEYEFIRAFETSYRMSPVNQFPVIMVDDGGTYWNIFGEAVEGPRLGERLSVPTAYTALYWAWEGVFEDKTILVN